MAAAFRGRAPPSRPQGPLPECRVTTKGTRRNESCARACRQNAGARRGSGEHSQHHDVEQRLARLLLTMSHYAGSRELLMVHESITALLGVRRAGVTLAASNLQMAGLISYRRGRISILGRRGLQRRSCECYRFISGQHEQLQVELRRLLFHN